MKKIILFFLLFCLTLSNIYSQSKESKEEKDERMKWWREARFGMFIHWGVYSVPAGTYKDKKIKGIGEWIMHRAKIPISEYEEIAGQFNPVKFNAEEWVQIAKNAGMKYIVITSKHHDGFCLWDSKITRWDIMDASPFRRDILKELADACQKNDIRLSFYHSIMDWHHPDAQAPFYPNYNNKKKSNPNFPGYVKNYLKPQLKELLANYGKIGILWFDGEWIKDWTSPMGKDMYNYIRSLQPEIIINNRVDKGRQGMSGMNEEGNFAGDYGTPEQEVPATGLSGVDWESCMTMNKTWGFKSFDHDWKSSETLIRNLVDIASKGGNYLLNVGPTSEGLIPKPSIERLEKIGKWIKKNKEAIYDTSANPFKFLEWGRCTKKVSKESAILYLHVFNWPDDGRLLVPAIKNRIDKAYLLTDPDKKSLKTKVNDDGVEIRLPKIAPDKISSTVVLKIKGKLDIGEMILSQRKDGSIILPAIEAKLYGEEIKYLSGRKRGRDYIKFFKSTKDWAEWEFKVKKPGEFNVSAKISAKGRGSFQLITANQVLNGTATKTRKDYKFRNISLGTLKLPSKGKTTIKVIPVKKGLKPFNLNSIILSPIQ